MNNHVSNMSFHFGGFCLDMNKYINFKNLDITCNTGAYAT